MIHAVAPASCGELLQGWLLGGEKLISYSIDCYSHVFLRENPLDMQISSGSLKHKARYSKAYKILKRVLQYYGVPAEEAFNLHLEIKSEIPVGKGMASSTADLAATALATAAYLGKNITQREIAYLCVEIEPTDSTIFSEITLFDQLQGRFMKGYGHLPPCRVLLLEGKGRVNTLEFRKINRREKLLRQKDQMRKALHTFEVGMDNQDLSKIGEASILSGLANQPILYKPGLEDMVELGIKLGASGVNVAHSGTVVGLLYEDGKFNQEKFIYELKRKPFFKNYCKAKDYLVVTGGAKVVQD
ncbi:GHMP family kinase ATP-binding protein [Alkaliphilus hydrothermalis]|uniref:L-threonine kinase n=1 Tax=Alkaliphilus hydrothermalis TaxID=1482730 RepID=A0ABS2NPD4_9FIRM|nr:propanediol utilization protein [Alkaliphilus hydrothermalis]MBM7614721.1 L-threonine kinase [Alkaliphilus hydrothermalis]